MAIIQATLSGGDPLSFSEVRAGFAGLEDGTSMRDFLHEFNKSNSDTISLSEFAGSRIVVTTISTHTTSQNLKTLFEASTEYSGWDSVKPFFMTIVINSTKVLYSTSSGTPALTIGTIPSNVYVGVINNGNIVGGPGNGGASGTANGGSGGNGVAGGTAVDFTGFTGRGIITNSAKVQGGAGGGGGGNGGASGTYTGQEIPIAQYGPHPNWQVLNIGVEQQTYPGGSQQMRLNATLYYGVGPRHEQILQQHTNPYTSNFPFPAPASSMNSVASNISNPYQGGGQTVHWYAADDANYPASGNYMKVAKELTFNTNGGVGGAGGNGAVFNGSMNAGGSAGSATGNNSAKDSSQVGDAGTGTAGGAGGYFSYSSGTDTYTYAGAIGSSGTAGSKGTGILNKPTNVSQP